jgi:hypothetical protein
MSTSISERQEIIDVMMARFATVTIANGYRTDLGKKVTSWETPGADQDFDLWCDIRDSEAKPEERSFQKHEHDLDFEVEVAKRSGSTGPTSRDLRKIISDLLEAVGLDRKWGRDSVLHTKILGNKILIDRKEKVTGYAVIKFRVTYRTPMYQH